MTDTPLENEYQRARDHCGYFWMEDWQLGEAAGKDTFSFLQTQTTNDCLALKAGEGHLNAVVTRKANLLGTFTLYKTTEEHAFLLMEKYQAEKVIASLEQFHFRENVAFEKHLASTHLLAIQGPKSRLLLAEISGQVQTDFTTCEIRQLSIDGESLWVMEKNLVGESGFILVVPEPLKEKVFSAIEKAGEPLGLGPLDSNTRETLRIEAGLPVYGRDMDEKYLLPETGLEHTAVSYSKGCYTGQEVIARMKTYGAPSFALMGLTLEEDASPPAPGTELKLGNKRLGVIKSGAFSPTLNRHITLAYIQKDYRSPDQTLEVTANGETLNVTTALLPFYQPASNLERAETLHRQAMDLYKKEENLDAPIALLREAISLAPKFAMGYEALGVLLSKQNKLDEAIALMKRLTEINPKEIMAHSNLSVYYMQQGRIEEAEQEKGEATALQFEQLIEAKQQEKAQESKAQEEEAERERQIGLFKQVLEIDPVDQVANFGLGSIYFERKQYEDALPLLETVVEHFRDYSAAYLVLGKTLQMLERDEDAAEVFRRGIAAASKKGDLMPLRVMQNRLNQLSHSEP